MVNLNLGCGDDLRGEVRIDIDPECKGINILADGHHIPLRDKTIATTLCKLVLEHVDSPIKTVLDIKRVTHGDIVIIVPNVMNIRRIIRTLKDPMYKINNKARHLQGLDAKLIKYLAFWTGLEVGAIRYGNIRFHRYDSHSEIYGHLIPVLFSGHMMAILRDVGGG